MFAFSLFHNIAYLCLRASEHTTFWLLIFPTNHHLEKKTSMNNQYTVKLRFSVDFSMVYWGLWWACWEYGDSLRFLLVA